MNGGQTSSATMPATWRGSLTTRLSARKPGLLLLSGSMIMLFGTALTSGVNFAYNISVARLLGPAEFSHATAAVALLMLFSAITLSFQLVCAKFIARNATVGGKKTIYQTLLRRAWRYGLLIGLCLVAASGLVSHLFRLPGASLICLLAIGVIAAVPLGVKRGTLQGFCDFPQLSLNFVGEAVVKLGTALALVLAGYGAYGAVAGLSAGVLFAYLLPRITPFRGVKTEPAEPASFREGMQAIVFFVGQVVINNIDILLVKLYFPPVEAGVYAAVALVGRLLYFASWSVVSAMFPISAAVKEEHEDVSVIMVPLLLVLSLALLFLLIMTFFAGPIVSIIFGAGYAEAKELLPLYAAATGLYVVSVVLMTYEMSRRIANTGWLQLAVSGVLVVAISLFHHSLEQVVLVQIVLMVMLVISVSFPFVRRYRSLRSPGTGELAA